jgi:hypothetical protein
MVEIAAVIGVHEDAKSGEREGPAKREGEGQIMEVIVLDLLAYVEAALELGIDPADLELEGAGRALHPIGCGLN